MSMRTIGAKLILAFLAVIAVSLVPASLAAGKVIRDYQRQDALERLAVLGQTVTSASVGPRFAQLTPAEIVSVFNEQKNGDVLIAITDGRGVVQADSTGKYVGKEWSVPEARAEPHSGPMRPAYKGQLTAPDGQEYGVAAFRIDRRPRPGSPPPNTAATAPADATAVVIVAMPWDAINSVWAMTGNRLKIIVLVASLLAILLAYVLSRSLTSRLRTLTEGAHAMARGDYARATRLASVGGGDEVGELAAAFGTMATSVARAQQAQRDLVANVSHELKTPLTSIQGFSQAMSDGTVSDVVEYRELAQIIQQESQRMRRLVEQMLELSRLESGTVPLDLACVRVDEFVENIGKRYARLAEARGVAVQWGAPGGLTVTADGGRLEQVLVNLLDNALQYTDSGGTVTLVAQAAQPGGASFVVRDTGRGIPAEDVPRLFERFYQVERARAGQGRHVGLGLAIVREIVDAHHGRIAVESAVGVGTTVTVTIPNAADARDRAGAAKPGEGYAFGPRAAVPT